MTETILVSHPAAVVHVPRGARRERLELVRLRTPAVLNELAPDAFEPLRDASGRTIDGMAMRDGRVWARLAPAGVPVPADAFRAFLRGEPAGTAGTVRGLGLNRGPLLADVTCAPSDRPTDPLDGRGVAIDPGMSRSIAYDGRAGAAAAAADYVSRDCAIVSGEAWTRIRPLVRYRHDGHHDLTLLRHPFATPAGGTFHLGLDGIESGVATLRNGWDRTPDRDPALAALLEALPRGHAADDDIHYLANTLPGRMVQMIDAAYPQLGGRLAGTARDMRLAAIAAMTGGIPDERAPEVIDLVRTAADAILAVRRHHSDCWLLDRVRRHIDANVAPRLAARAGAPDMSAFAP